MYEGCSHGTSHCCVWVMLEWLHWSAGHGEQRGLMRGEEAIPMEYPVVLAWLCGTGECGEQDLPSTQPSMSQPPGSGDGGGPGDIALSHTGDSR